MRSPHFWPHAIAIAATCSIAPAALAWNDRGHMLAAIVAYRELTPEVRDRVNAILKAHPQHDLLAAGGDYSKDTPVLPSDYEEQAKHIAANQVVLAGYRMADVLNDALVTKRGTSMLDSSTGTR